MEGISAQFRAGNTEKIPKTEVLNEKSFPTPFAMGEIYTGIILLNERYIHMKMSNYSGFPRNNDRSGGSGSQLWKTIVYGGLKSLRPRGGRKSGIRWLGHPLGRIFRLKRIPFSDPGAVAVIS